MGAGVTFIAVEMISALAYLAWWREGRPKSRAFLDFLFANFPDKPVVGAAEGSRIIVP